MSHALSSLLVAGALMLGVGACGPSPAAQSGAEAGTLVVVIRQGAERVPFHPKVARIQRANAQLATLLGHSIQIELDGAILPQTHEGAEDVIASLVELVVRDINGLAKGQKDSLPFARDRFERLVVRYSPAETAGREEPWRRPNGAKLDPATRTIDVVVADARSLSLRQGTISQVLFAAYAVSRKSRYANVSPDALPPSEYRAWFDYHAGGNQHLGGVEHLAPLVQVGAVDSRTVRGMLVLRRIAASDQALLADVRSWLIHEVVTFGGAYSGHLAEIERAPPTSPFRQAEAEYMAWLKGELPRMTLDERTQFVDFLWIVDFRKDGSERDRFASLAFPGVDRMAFYFDAVDEWIAAGHPPIGNFPRRPDRRNPPPMHPLYDRVIAPAVIESSEGRLTVFQFGRGDRTFYRWAFADRDREDRFVQGLKARSNTALAGTVFVNARSALRDEAEYLRFLRRFEGTPVYWSIGADAFRESIYNPSPLVVDEARRLWRDVPSTRGQVFFWFARHVRHSYHPEVDWPDLLQGVLSDAVILDAFLDLGWEAFELLPTGWPGIAKGPSRTRAIIAHAKPLLGTELKTQPGEPSLAGVLARVARLLCEERAASEIAELRRFAQDELAQKPGAGLSDVIAATDPAICKPSKPRLGHGAANRKGPRQ